MAKKGEIVINEQLCKGCGYCVHFCPNGCFTMTGDRVSASGVILPVFAEPEKCNACKTCGLMCPEMAIEVYRLVEAA